VGVKFRLETPKSAYSEVSAKRKKKRLAPLAQAGKQGTGGERGKSCVHSKMLK